MRAVSFDLHVTAVPTGSGVRYRAVVYGLVGGRYQSILVTVADTSDRDLPTDCEDLWARMAALASQAVYHS